LPQPVHPARPQARSQHPAASSEAVQGLKETTLGNWVKKAKDAEAEPGEAAPSPEERKRIRDPEAEVRRLNLEKALTCHAS